jgi:hypothetical protein
MLNGGGCGVGLLGVKSSTLSPYITDYSIHLPTFLL